MEEKLKYIPLALLLVFGLKGLALGTSYADVAALAVLGVTAFLYELNIQNKTLSTVQQDLVKTHEELAKNKQELEHIKAYTTSLKMGQARNVGTIR
jgi:hypothetical protein